MKNLSKIKLTLFFLFLINISAFSQNIDENVRDKSVECIAKKLQNKFDAMKSGKTIFLPFRDINGKLYDFSKILANRFPAMMKNGNFVSYSDYDEIVAYEDSTLSIPPDKQQEYYTKRLKNFEANYFVVGNFETNSPDELALRNVKIYNKTTGNFIYIDDKDCEVHSDKYGAKPVLASLALAGAGQIFYKNEKSKGFIMLGIDALLLAGIGVSYNRYNYYDTQMKRTSSSKTMDSYRTSKNISLGAMYGCVGGIVLNHVISALDARSGRNEKSVSFVPYKFDNYYCFCICINYFYCDRLST